MEHERLVVGEESDAVIDEPRINDQPHVQKEQEKEQAALDAGPHRLPDCGSINLHLGR